MSIAIKVPSVGESITEGTIARWLKKNGDSVKANEPLFELETEKATNEIPAPVSGTLTISVPEGQTVPIGGVIGQIEAGAVPNSKPASPEPAKPASTPTPQGNHERNNATTPRSEVVSSPAARQIAASSNIDLSKVSGSGRGGLITKEDVLGFMEVKPSATPATEILPPAPVKEEPAATAAVVPSGAKQGKG